MDNFCPLCMEKGFTNNIELIQVNLEEAVWICTSEKCTWPFGHEDFVFVPRIAGKIWSYHWENYKTNVRRTKLKPRVLNITIPNVNSRSLLENGTILTPVNGTCKNINNVAVVETNNLQKITRNEPHLMEILINNPDNEPKDSTDNTLCVKTVETVVEKQKNPTVATKSKLLARKNVNVGKRYEKFSFSAIQPKIKEETNETVNDSHKTIDNDTALSENFNTSISQSENKEMDYKNCDTRFENFDNLNDSVNIDSLLNEFFTDSVVPKDSCDDWLEDLLGTANA